MVCDNSYSGGGAVTAFAAACLRAGELPARWWVIQTRDKREASVEAALAADRVEHFCPSHDVLRVYGRLRRSVRKVLFPTYVFARSASAVGEGFSRRGGHVVRVIEVGDQALIEQQLAAVRLACAAGVELVLRAGLTAGRLARVRAGALRGVVGVVADPTAPGCVVLRLDLLGQEVLVKVVAGDLEVLP